MAQNGTHAIEQEEADDISRRMQRRRASVVPDCLPLIQLHYTGTPVQ